MKQRCEYCGTEYDSSLDQCPLCGSASPVQEPEEVPRQAPEEAAPEKDRIPRGLQVAICLVLGLAVVIGAVFAVSQLGLFAKDGKPQDEKNLQLPITDDGKTSGDDGQQPDPTPDDGEKPDTQPDETPVKEPDKPVEVKVPEVACTKLSLSRTDVSFFEAGESFQLKAEISPADTTEKVVYESRDESLCTVDETGKVTAVNGGGTTEIVVTCGQQTKSCTIRCKFVYDASLAPETDKPSGTETYVLNSTDITLFEGGEKAKLTLKNAPVGAQIAWSTSNASVATVSDDGTVTAVAAGTCTVSASLDGQTAQCIVRCRITGTAVATDGNAESTGEAALSQTDVTLHIGESFALKAEGGAVQSWSTSDASVATVSGGKVTASGAGTATVSAVVDGKKLDCIVRVKGS